MNHEIYFLKRITFLLFFLSILSIPDSTYAQTAVKPIMESVQNALEANQEGLPLKKVTDKAALAKAKAMLDKGRPTLRFEQNQGQFSAEVLYKAKAKQATHFFLKNEMRSMVSDSKGEEHLAYAIEFKGANTKPQISGKGNAQNRGGRQNYIQPSGTYSDVPMFRRLDYKDLWTGIHAKFHEKEGGLKYDFVVESGADPTQVQLQMKGATDLKVNAKGELEFTTAFGTLRKGAPYTFQRVHNKTVKVESAYQIDGDVISFKIGSYDPALPLIIDPIALLWSTFLGGEVANTIPFALYVDETTGRVYVTGRNDAADFPTTTGTAFKGITQDAFVTCLEADGSSIVWSTLIGGTGINSEYFSEIYVNAGGDVFLQGTTQSADFPTNGSVAAYSSTLTGEKSSLLVRLSADGATLLYSSYFPVSQSGGFSGMAVNGDIVYSTTYYRNTHHTSLPFTPPAAAYQNTYPGGSNILLYAINTTIPGSAGLVYATFYGSAVDNTGYIYATSMGIDSLGNIYVAGYTRLGTNSDDILTADAIQTYTSLNALDAGSSSNVDFVAKFDPTLSNLLYGTLISPMSLPGEYYESEYFPKIWVEDNGDIYHTDYWAIYAGSDIDFNNLTFAPNNKLKHLSPLATYPTAPNIMSFTTVSKIAANNPSEFDYIATMGGSLKYDLFSKAVVDSKGRLHYAYQVVEDDTEIAPLATPGALQTTANGMFIQYIVLSATADLAYATVLGGTGVGDFMTPTDLYVTEDCKTYIVGNVEPSDQTTFPVTPSYRDPDTDMQVTIYDATPSPNTNGFISVFHNVNPATNTITDFAPGNNTFCVNSLIYQNPNDGPILGTTAGFVSGDGSATTHNLPDIRPSPYTEAHPTPSTGDIGYSWDISTDNGTTWSVIPGADLEIYKPAAQSVAGTVQYRRTITGFCCDTLSVSNVATATIVGTSTLTITAPTEPVYYCSGSLTDLGIVISGASGNIDWQWYDGFTPLTASDDITPVSGSGVAEGAFTASVSTTATKNGFFRLVVTDGTGCKQETTVTISPLTAAAFVGTELPRLCPGATSSFVLGPAAINPLFDYSWTGPSGFTSSLANPTVSVDGTYTLQVKLTTDAAFCAAGATSVTIAAAIAHDAALTAIPDAAFCQPDAPEAIGLTGTAPAGYVFQWAPGINIDDATLYSPIFDPGILPFGVTPVDTVEYTFTALRTSDGCIFETTMMVTDTARALAQAGIDLPSGCINIPVVFGAPETNGNYWEWRTVATTYPGGLAALTSHLDFSMDGSSTNLATNKFLTASFPDHTACYTIDYEIIASYVPFPTNCFTRDTARLFYCPGDDCGDWCSDLTSNNMGTDGACSGTSTIIGGSSLGGLTYTWTTYSVDGVVQPANTAPQGLFEINVDDTKGVAFVGGAEHPSQAIADFDDASWGWLGANVVIYRLTGNGNFGEGVVDCHRDVQVFSANDATPVIAVLDQSFCAIESPGIRLGSSGEGTPYTISGVDYTQAPNGSLLWTWTELGGGTGSITSDGDTPFPTLEPSGTTNYIIAVEDPITGCTALDTMVFEGIPVVANAGSDISAVCESSIVQLGTPEQSNHTYSWSPGTGLFFPASPPTPNSTAAAPFLTVPLAPSGVTFTVTVTETTTGCQATDDITITTNTSGPFTPQSATYYGCADGTFLIGGTYNNNNTTGVTFNWTAGAGADIAWLDDVSVNKPIITLPNSFVGPATFTLSVTKGLCGTSSRDYIINAPISIDLGSDIVASCNPPYAQIGVASNSAYTYQWIPASGLYLDAAATMPYDGGDHSQVFAAATQTETYTLIATEDNTGCVVSDDIIVSPPVGVGVDAGADAMYCTTGSPVSIGASGSGTLTWTAVGYNSNPDGSPATPTAGESTTMLGYLSSNSAAIVNFSQSTGASGKYVYRLTSSSGGCVAFDEVTVVVRAITVDLAGGPQSVCSGNPVQLGVADAPGNYNYVWTALSPALSDYTISATDADRPIVSPIENSVYQVTYTDPSTGCSNTEVVAVSVTPPPVVADVSTPVMCAPVAAQDLTALITSYGTYFNPIWYINSVPGTVLTTPTSVSPSQTTNYFLVVENQYGCTDTALVTVNVDNPKAPNIITNVATSCPTTSIDLADYQGTPSNLAYTLEWHSDNTTNPATLLTNTVVSASGTYYLFETTPNGCSSVSDNSVYVAEVCCPAQNCGTVTITINN